MLAVAKLLVRGLPQTVIAMTRIQFMVVLSMNLLTSQPDQSSEYAKPSFFLLCV